MKAYLATGNTRRDSRSQLAESVREETEGVELGTPLSDLEPVSAASVPASRGLTTGNLTEVDSSGSSMVESVVELESDRGARRDGDSL